MLPACAAQSTEFRLSDVDAGEAAIAGRLHVSYNGELSTRDCSACFNGSEDCVLANEGGFVFHKLPVGRNAFVEVRCVRSASSYHHGFKPRYFNAPRGRVTYIGDFFVEWQTEGGYKTSMLFGALGAAIDEAGDDGRARLWVRDNRKEVLRAFAKQTGWHGTLFVSLAGGRK
jgi:hypothetical protein